MDRESERGEIRGYTERQRGLENPGPLNLRLLFFFFFCILHTGNLRLNRLSQKHEEREKPTWKEPLRDGQNFFPFRGP